MMIQSHGKLHRRRVMHKMNARSLPELGRMTAKLKLVTEKPHAPEAGYRPVEVDRKCADVWSGVTMSFWSAPSSN
jgi:hypothetical protein